PKPAAEPFKPKKDPELERLREKYAELNPDATPSATLTAKGGQSELDRLKEKYERLNRPTETPVKTEVADPSSDPTLEEMKRRYNSYHNRDGYQTKTDYSRVETPEPVPAESTTSFEELEETVILELEHQLYPQLTVELQQDLTPEIKEEVRRELPPAQRDYLDAIEPSPKPLNTAPPPVATLEADPLHSELKTHLKDPVEQHLRAQLEPMVRLSLKQEFTYQVKLKHEAALRDKLTELTAETPTPPLAETTEPPLKSGYQEIERDILLVPIKKGNVIPLNNLFFDANEATLKQASFAELERLENFLKDNPNIIVEIGGHTNGWCSHEFAKELSENRAKVVVDFLAQSGIPSSRISYHGYGKTQPIAPNNTADGRRKNQRVELKIIEILSE
ncbi:MAG: OmpA family protein, partial [Phaeodactylibacter sp.]|nr:OmpA family protein [Phaeodactylibacter sp.]